MTESTQFHALDDDARVRDKAPLIHQITNFVVMNFTANVTLALGAQPVMSHAVQELEEMQGFASALVVNIGTLDDVWIESMLRAARVASDKGVPVILDPVGAGATRLRTDVARRILDGTKVAVVRGNAGEILAVAGDGGQVRGVDSLAEAQEVVGVARRFAEERGVIVAMTGAVDVVTDGVRTYCIENGHPLMGRVTGTGCGSTVAVASYVGVADVEHRCEAAVSALAVYGRAGEIAAEASRGPGTFVPAFLDALYQAPTVMKGQDFRVFRKE
ncbi:MAG TPA: hydroxyethylthiazole kinase [Polyangiaceae bacterium]|nr:hydroxyethylthiazole kinase [Polyangiaceae bacterium]